MTYAIYADTFQRATGFAPFQTPTSAERRYSGIEFSSAVYRAVEWVADLLGPSYVDRSRFNDPDEIVFEGPLGHGQFRETRAPTWL